MFPAGCRRLETSDLERDFRIQAETLRRTMEGVHIAFRRIQTNVAAALVTILLAEYRQPVVLPVDAMDGDAETIRRLLARIENPVLLVQ
jgi:5-methylcytosine-specific restriction endonuclease McrBC GTP-binding regulatory subunit McrB